MAMHWISILFIAAVTAGTVVELWLAQRQVDAVLVHRDQVPEPFAGQISADDHRKAADYTIARAKFSRIGTVLGAGVTLALTVGGGVAGLDTIWRGSGWAQPWLGTAVIATVACVVTVINLPLSLWRTFRLEARFGFNRTTALLFLADLAKGLLITVLLGGPLVLATLMLMGHTGRWWWAWVWLVWLGVTLLVTWAWPVFIAPLFNRFSPLQDPALGARIEALLERCGFRSKGVFVVDGSRRSTHGNAYFTGIGRNKRIVFFDTLLSRIEAAEIEAVLAHELGHFRLHHVRQRLTASVVLTFGGLALLAWLARQPGFYTALGVPAPSAAMALLLFVLTVPVFSFFATPFMSWWSRRHERQADDFAAEYADAGKLAAALVKLFRDNAATLTPDRIHSAFFDSHPPALERIGRLNALARAS